MGVPWYTIVVTAGVIGEPGSCRNAMASRVYNMLMCYHNLVLKYCVQRALF